MSVFALQFKHCFLPAIALLLLAGCAQKPGQSNYLSTEVGVSHTVEFGTVINVRPVKITHKGDNEAGTLIGAGAGAGGGSYVGRGSGNAWAIAGGAILGAVIGNAVEQEIRNSEGFEYTLAMRNGKTKMITQEKIEGDQVFKPGDKVMLQRCDAGQDTKKCPAASQFQRLLPVAMFPDEQRSESKSSNAATGAGTGMGTSNKKNRKPKSSPRYDADDDEY